MYFRLPSKNHFYSDFSQEQLSILKEVGVSPMTLIHKLIIKNPEKLYNGSAVEEIIHDCTTIKSISAGKLLKNDVDSLLLGIKIATTGPFDQVHTECPECKERQEKSINVEAILGRAKEHDDKYFIDIPVGLVDRADEKEAIVRLYFRPSTFSESLEHSLTLKNNASLVEDLYSEFTTKSDEELTEDDVTAVETKTNQLLIDVTKSTLKTQSNCILRAVPLLENGEESLEYETDPSEIYSFILSLGIDEQTKINDKITEINSRGLDPIVEFECDVPECKHSWKFSYEINLSDFFGEGF